MNLNNPKLTSEFLVDSPLNLPDSFKDLCFTDIQHIVKYLLSYDINEYIKLHPNKTKEECLNYLSSEIAEKIKCSV